MNINRRGIGFGFGFNTTLYDWFKNLEPPIDQLDAKPKPITTWSHAFSRAWRRLCAFVLSSRWFILLFTFLLVWYPHISRHSFELGLPVVCGYFTYEVTVAIFRAI